MFKNNLKDACDFSCAELQILHNIVCNNYFSAEFKIN